MVPVDRTHTPAGQTRHLMKTIRMILAATLGVIAAAALVLFFRSPIEAEAFIGYGVVLAMAGVALLEYRIDWKRLLGRS
jgi:hypothetical protein